MTDIFLEPLDEPVVPISYGTPGDGPINVMDYLGESWVPHDVRRRRRWNLQTARRMGTPVVIKHMYNDRDVKNGLAMKSPTNATSYGQVRHDDPVSHGMGYVSIERATDEWYNKRTGEVVVAESDPGTEWELAPLYRGFGPGYLTWLIEPDVAEDLFKLNREGAMIQVQDATALAPWFPEINDNDLIINVVLDGAGRIIASKERFQAKMTSPVTMRGHQRRGRREGTEDGGNRFPVAQAFEMTRIPQTDHLYQVEVDR